MEFTFFKKSQFTRKIDIFSFPSPYPQMKMCIKWHGYLSQQQTCEDSAWVSIFNQTLGVFDLVPDYFDYRKQRTSIIIRHCEKAKKLNVISTCEVVTKIEECKHNCYLRLACARWYTMDDRKAKLSHDGLTDCKYVTWSLTKTCHLRDGWIYVSFLKDLFLYTKYCYICKLCFLFSLLAFSLFFFLLNFEISFVNPVTGYSSKLLIYCLDKKKHNVGW